MYKIYAVIIASAASLITELATFFYYRRKRKSDLQTKFLEKIEALSKKYITLH